MIFASCVKNLDKRTCKALRTFVKIWKLVRLLSTFFRTLIVVFHVFFFPIDHIRFGVTFDTDFGKGPHAPNIGLLKISPIYHASIDTFCTIRAVRKDAPYKVNTMHMCTHMFANGGALTTRREFKVNLVDTNNELLYRSEFSSLGSQYNNVVIYVPV